jgi:hypothetical protein
MQNMKLQPEGACQNHVPEYRIGGDLSAGVDAIFATVRPPAKGEISKRENVVYFSLDSRRIAAQQGR